MVLEIRAVRGRWDHMGVERRRSIGRVLREAARTARSVGVDVTVTVDSSTARTRVPPPAAIARSALREAVVEAFAAGAGTVALGASAWDGGLVITMTDDGRRREPVERLVETSRGVATLASYGHAGRRVWVLEYRWTPDTLPRPVDISSRAVILSPGTLQRARRLRERAVD